VAVLKDEEIGGISLSIFVVIACVVILILYKFRHRIRVCCGRESSTLSSIIPQSSVPIQTTIIPQQPQTTIQMEQPSIIPEVIFQYEPESPAFVIIHQSISDD
jgi:hypothetical protein